VTPTPEGEKGKIWTGHGTMSNYGVLNDRVFAEVKRLCYAGLDAAALQERLTAALKRAVAFDASAFFTTDPTSSLITGAVIDQMGDERDVRFFLEHVYFEDDLFQFDSLMRNRLPVWLLSEATEGQLDRALGYRELQSPLGWGYELKAVFATGSQLWGGLCMTREKGRQDFRPSEVAIIQRIARHVGVGLRAAVFQQDLDDRRDHDEAAGVLIFDNRGFVVEHNAAAEKRLNELGHLGPRWRDGQGIPEAVWTVLGALKRALKAEADHDLHNVPQLHVRGRQGRWLTLQASQTEACLSAQSRLLVIIVPAGPRQILELTTIGYGLSPREQEVVEWVTRGASTRHISDALLISDYTVKDHLANIFEKVGVSGRRELVKRLYLNTIGA
jgi:DNA-binding CsgD family transcriptional regulator